MALSHPDPSDSKKILNTLRNDHIQEWDDQKATVLMEALRSKFRQNFHLAMYLKETYPLQLGEALCDKDWGTGLNLSDWETTDHTKWDPQGNPLSHEGAGRATFDWPQGGRELVSFSCLTHGYDSC